MTPRPLDPPVAAALEDFREHFGHELFHHPTLAPTGFYRKDISVHTYFPRSPRPQPEPDFTTARRWLEERRVMLVRYPREFGRFGYYVAPIIPVPVAVAYHATARKNWPDIRREGLLPGDPAQSRASTADRFDCFGYFFVCPDLGTPADLGRQFTFTAHWWRGELAGRSGTDPNQEWMILGIDLTHFDGLVTNQDYLSESGVILSGVDSIPADRISVAWQP